MVSPGYQLDKIGYEKTPGPKPSMRLKSRREGLLDSELIFSQAQSSAAASALIEKHIPTVLSEVRGDSSWLPNSALWINYYKALLELAPQP